MCFLKSSLTEVLPAFVAFDVANDLSQEMKVKKVANLAKKNPSSW